MFAWSTDNHCCYGTRSRAYYNFSEAVESAIPIRTGRWFVRYQLIGAGDDAAQVRQVADLTEGHCLHERVAHRSGFIRSDDDTSAGGVGRHLVEQRILAAAADDMNRVETLLQDRFERGQLFAISEGETFERGANELAG